MSKPSRPAVYLPRAGNDIRSELIRSARQRGWPQLEIYTEQDGQPGAALASLTAAIIVGRHDAILTPVPDDPSPLVPLLRHCTSHGVTVSFVAPAAPVSARASAAAVAAPGDPAGALSAPVGEPWEVLARARLEALAGLFPEWRIWLDRSGWHGRRREGFLQGYRPGAPVFSVCAATATDLAAQLCWQQAADEHAPDGCQASIMSPPPWGTTGARMQAVR